MLMHVVDTILLSFVAVAASASSAPKKPSEAGKGPTPAKLRARARAMRARTIRSVEKMHALQATPRPHRTAPNQIAVATDVALAMGAAINGKRGCTNLSSKA